MSVRVQSPQSEAKIAAMFDRVAPRYDLLNRLLSARQDQRWRRALVQRLPYVPGGRFLDVATGTGDVLLAVGRAHTEYRALVGVDISRQMLQLAATKAHGAALAATPEFRPMSAESLDLPSDHFDALSIAFGLRNVVHREQALLEFRRVLRPGGVLLILEFFKPKAGLLAWLFQVYFHTILPWIGGLISDGDAYRYLPQSVGSFYSVDGFREALETSGFAISESKSFLFGACRLVKATKVKA